MVTRMSAMGASREREASGLSQKIVWNPQEIMVIFILLRDEKDSP
jgi:hypothetical protein